MNSTNFRQVFSRISDVERLKKKRLKMFYTFREDKTFSYFKSITTNLHDSSLYFKKRQMSTGSPVELSSSQLKISLKKGRFLK